MNYLVLESLKEMHKDGFRCIHAETDNNKFVIELKNFDTEESKTLKTKNLYEINRIKDFLNELEYMSKIKGAEY